MALDPSSSRRDLPVTGPGLLFGGDYNPEQWPEEVWAEDIRLMGQAGVTMVSVGIFSWARLEPSPGEYEFAWMDRVIDGLHAAGIGVNLATPSASPPPWLSHLHPETLPVTADGVRLGYGARESFCPSSPVYRAAAAAIAEQLVTRYAPHPGVVMWHVGNEFGAHIGTGCHCEVSRAAFGAWLRERYGDIEKLNEAWGTAFWSQHYRDFKEITTPVSAPMPVNPSQQLDFARFTSGEFLACYEAERDVLRRNDPERLITTNLMIGNCKNLDYWSWAESLDVVANDHYLIAASPKRHIDLSLAADLSRSLHAGRPWLLMEHSTSAVNWQPRNFPKQPGEMRRNALAHVARGSEGALFFQWRASRRGAEQLHSAMLPHGGTRTRVWGEVVELGADMARLGEVRGSRVRAHVAMWWDWQSWWAMEHEFRPVEGLSYLERVLHSYSALWSQGVTVDVVGPPSDLSGYSVLVVPSAFLLRVEDARRIQEWVAAGGHLIVSFFSAVVDESEAVHPEGFLGPLREVLGAWVDELHPLGEGEVVTLDDGASADLWAEALVPTTAEVVSRFTDGPLANGPAVTANYVGAGRAWYVVTRLAENDLEQLYARVLAEAGVHTPAGSTPGVEVIVRHGDEADFTFVINHTDQPATCPTSGTDLLTGASGDDLHVPAGGVAVVRTPRPATSARAGVGDGPAAARRPAQRADSALTLM